MGTNQVETSYGVGDYLNPCGCGACLHLWIFTHKCLKRHITIRKDKKV